MTQVDAQPSFLFDHRIFWFELDCVFQSRVSPSLNSGKNREFISFLPHFIRFRRIPQLSSFSSAIEPYFQHT